MHSRKDHGQHLAVLEARERVGLAVDAGRLKSGAGDPIASGSGCVAGLACAHPAGLHVPGPAATRPAIDATPHEEKNTERSPPYR